MRAAWLGGSDATGRTDAYSDLDLLVVAEDDRVEDVFAAIEATLTARSPIEHRYRLPPPTWHGHEQAFYQLEKAGPFLLLDMVVMKLNSEERYLELTNPSTRERAVLRRELLPSLLQVAADNSRFCPSIRLFEIGTVFERRESEPLPRESNRLALVISGPREGEHWQGEGSGDLGFYDLKGLVEGVESTLRLSFAYEAGERELETLWGNGKEAQIKRAGAAMREMGVTEAMLSGMEDSIGYVDTMKWAAGIANRLSEDTFVAGSGEGGTGFNSGMTPEKAKLAWDARVKDPAFNAALMDKAHPNHKSALKEQHDTFSVIYPD